MNNDELMTGKDLEQEELTGEDNLDKEIFDEGFDEEPMESPEADSEEPDESEILTGDPETEDFSSEDSKDGNLKSEYAQSDGIRFEIFEPGENQSEENGPEENESGENESGDEIAQDAASGNAKTADPKSARPPKKQGALKKHFLFKKSSKEKDKKQKRKHSRHYMKALRKRAGIVLAVVVVILAVVLIHVYRTVHVNSKYSVLSTSEREGSVDSSYETFCGEILRYSSDGAALTDTDGTAIWNETFDMDTPILDMDDDIAAVYDQKGTDIYIFDSKGVVGTVTADKPILKARVSSEGMIAAILEDGDTTWINFYSTSGETIATAKTRIDSPGYPVDMDVSQNGKLLAVSYLYVDGDTPTSYVAFYNFSTAGQSQMDNVVSAYTYADVMVPQIAFLSGSTAAAIRDNGIMLYTGSEIPAESFTVDEDEEILSCFMGDSFIGLVTENTNENSTNPYVMTLYNLKGKQIAQRAFSGDYTTIRVDDDMIFLYNDRQLCIFNNKGRETFQGVIKEGSVQDVCRVSTDRFLVVMSDKIETIKVK